MAYGKVEETFWHDPVIRALSRDARDLYLYLLTCPHKNRLGCFVFDPWYGAADLQWDLAAVTAGIAELQAAGRVSWDPTHRILFVRRFLKHNVLENQNVVLGATTELKKLPDTPLLRELLAAVIENKRPHYHELVVALTNRLGNGLPNGMPNPPVKVKVKATATVKATPSPSPCPTPSPHTPTPPAREADPVLGQNGAHPASDQLARWLGPQAAALERLPMFTDQRLRTTLHELYGPPGLNPNAWKRGNGTSVPEPERPPLFLATAIGYGSEPSKRFVANEFRGALRRTIADEQTLPRGPDTAPLSPDQYARYRAIRGELEDGGMDPEEAAAEADQRARRE